ncbi:MAG: 5-formyltetrahydrofolate cyclo-ligase [Alphaproteobacteria bacterium PA2]|nr:MAG: 5-formyltetrahydrofolate cyclo-ligase [Alphaproteobacteria bacterium PA2]
MASKHDLRRVQRSLRRDLADRFPGAAGAAAELLPKGLKPATVGGYLPMGGELDPGPVLKVLQGRGALLALPVCLAPASPLIFRAYCQGDGLAPDAMGLPAPTEAAASVTPDVLIIPLLAFDRRGGRLGQGGGFYDRTLEALRRQGRVLAIGLAYAGLEVEEAPMIEHDQSLDAILTETGYIVPQRT